MAWVAPMPDINPPLFNRRVETATGSTNASGQFTFTFPQDFASVPHISAEMMPSPNTETFLRVMSVSASAVTIHVFSRTGLTVLGISLLSMATVNVSAIPVSIMAMERI